MRLQLNSIKSIEVRSTEQITKYSEVGIRDPNNSTQDKTRGRRRLLSNPSSVQTVGSSNFQSTRVESSGTKAQTSRAKAQDSECIWEEVSRFQARQKTGRKNRGKYLHRMHTHIRTWLTNLTSLGRRFRIPFAKFFTSQAWDFVLTNSYSGWQFNLQPYTVNEDEDIFAHTQMGEISDMLELFQSGEASPYDHDEEGNNLLYVSLKSDGYVRL